LIYANEKFMTDCWNPPSPQPNGYRSFEREGRGFLLRSPYRL